MTGTGMMLAAAASLALVACGRETPAENMAETLEEAAEYSTPEAAEVLENEAERIRAENVTDPAYPQRVLEEAGNAQVPPPQPRTEPLPDPQRDGR